MTKDPAMELAKTIVELEKTAGVYKDKGARGYVRKEMSAKKKKRKTVKNARKRNR